jgi:hypothetical protein
VVASRYTLTFTFPLRNRSTIYSLVRSENVRIEIVVVLSVQFRKTLASQTNRLRIEAASRVDGTHLKPGLAKRLDGDAAARARADHDYIVGISRHEDSSPEMIPPPSLRLEQAVDRRSKPAAKASRLRWG